MATVGTDKRTGNITVRVYGAKDLVTKQVYKPSATLPKNAPQEDINRTIERLELKAGVAKKTGRALTIGGLVAYYLDEVCEKQHKSPTTIESYESNARCYVYKTIGSVPYDKAEPGLFSSLYDQLKKPKTEGGCDLSQRTIKKLHSFLSGCFNALIAEKVIDRNVIRDLKIERGEAAEAKALEHSDFDRLLDYLYVSNGVGGIATLDTALLIDAYTGVRRGELAGFLVEDWYSRPMELRVRWSIAETKRGLVRKGTKRGKVRFVGVAEDAAECIERHIAAQAEWLAGHGVNQGGKTALFAGSDGGPLRPSKFYERFVELRRKLAIDPKATLKSLRHTQATYLLEDGENIKLIQQRMGHANQATTIDIYSHVMPGRDRAAASRFGEIAGSRKRVTED